MASDNPAIIKAFLTELGSGSLDKAADYGITVVSMKRDWRAVFAAAPKAQRGAA